jgi:hypothetical protein
VTSLVVLTFDINCARAECRRKNTYKRYSTLMLYATLTVIDRVTDTDSTPMLIDPPLTVTLLCECKTLKTLVIVNVTDTVPRPRAGRRGTGTCIDT